MLDIGKKVYITKDADHWFKQWGVKPVYGILVETEEEEEDYIGEDDEGEDVYDIHINHFFDLYDSNDKLLMTQWFLQKQEFTIKPPVSRKPEEWL
jgi:hypothetical protein